MPTNNDRKYDLKMFEQDIYTRLWFTYRKDFPPINGTKYTSDCGWGCMLRSVQMLIAQGFLLHFLGREWNFLQSTSRHDHFLNREIISWFNDRPGNKCPFGIHRLINLAEKMGKKVGDWFGPGTVTLIMKDALEQAQEFITILDDKIRIYVAQDCTIYKKDVLELCTKNIRRNSTVSDLNVPFVPVLLLISVRLGGEDLNEIYVPILKLFLEMENCLGIIGGKPKHSLYMTGYQGMFLCLFDWH
jgi:cysteine protease ATG4